MRKENLKICYPLLKGIYPAIGQIAVIINQMKLVDGIRSFLAALIFSIMVYIIISWHIHGEHGAALLCTWFILFSFPFGEFIESTHPIGYVRLKKFSLRQLELSPTFGTLLGGILHGKRFELDV